MNIGIVDIETTGFFNKGGLIIEIGIVSLDTETGEITPVYDSVVREAGLQASHANAWIFSNCDLTFAEVERAPSLASQQAIIQGYLDAFDHGITAYNKDFDFTFLRDRGFVIGKELPCPMKVATPICKLPSTGYGDYKWPKVEEAWDHFVGTPYTELHRGLDDAMHEARIVYEMIKLEEFEIG